MSTIFFTSSPNLLVDYDRGAAATTVQKKVCRAVAAVAAFAPTATTDAVAASDVLLCCCRGAAELLLCCCCCQIRVPLLRVANKNMLCFAMPTDLSFFRYGTCIFVI